MSVLSFCWAYPLPPAFSASNVFCLNVILQELLSYNLLKAVPEKIQSIYYLPWRNIQVADVDRYVSNISSRYQLHFNSRQISFFLKANLYLAIYFKFDVTLTMDRKKTPFQLSHCKNIYFVEIFLTVRNFCLINSTFDIYEKTAKKKLFFSICFIKF